MLTRMLASPIVVSLCLMMTSTVFAQTAPKSRAKSDILDYIDSAWDTLTRDPVSCEAMVDPKLGPGESVLYFPTEVEPTPEALARAARCKVRVEHLPQKITALGTFDLSQLKRHGLLYLPNKYVVPGGRFNEMYGWDSYFIVVGLLESGRLELARGMVDNFVFEIEHYGGVLNANRTYYLTRSQPPFFTAMALAVYNADKEHKFTDKAWLERVYAAAQKDHAMWTSGAHLAGDTGLSRYFDFGEGPVPEEAHDGYKYYKDAAKGLIARGNYDYFVPAKPGDVVVTELPQGLNKAKGLTGPVTFSADFYKGDRALRESGFDITNRFGPYGAETHHYAPVCLNSLLAREELDLGWMATTLGLSQEAAKWNAQAKVRRLSIKRNLYASARILPAPGYYDLDFHSKSLHGYLYATTFYPLWAGITDPALAEGTLKALTLLLQPGGLATSSTETGLQWDAPYGWAPLQMIASDGLRLYGAQDEADEISKRWLRLVIQEFRSQGTIREKYDVVRRTAAVNISAGYKENVVGFGWTNGVFLHLLHQLSKAEQEELLAAPKAKTASAK